MPAASPLARSRGAVMLAAEAVDHLTARVHEFHRAISDIPFGTLDRVPAVNAGSRPTRLVHDGITDGVYGVIRAAAKGVFDVADQLLRRAESTRRLALPAPATPALTDGRPHARVQDDLVAAVSGLVGDHMAARRNPLAIRAGVYYNGHRIALTPDALAAAFPQATPRIAVFVHGLCSNENVWSMFERADDPQTRPYGQRLAQDLGFTPVYLRYNSGLHVSINGRSIARMLAALHAHWPVPVGEIVLIGHSMGGLVARSAAEKARRRDAAWIGALSQVVCLGSPHLGAPLEKAVHVGTNLMHRLPLTRPVARLLDLRSLGIKGLRWGYTVDEEWRGRTADAWWTDDRLQFDPLPRVRYRFLGACLHEDHRHPLSHWLGDGLVRLPSSLAADVAGADIALRLKLGHLRLLNHPDVYAQLHRWLAEGPLATTGAAA